MFNNIFQNAFSKHGKYVLISGIIITGILISLINSYIFELFWYPICGETKKRSDALNKLQQILAKEYELESLGDKQQQQHTRGTPLATISVVSKEKKVGDDSKLTKDLDLLISQTKDVAKF